MKVIKPTKQEVFNSLRQGGCCWLGGHGCECYSRQLKSCFELEEKRLTRTEYTEEEIEQAKAKDALKELFKAMDEALESV